VYLVKDTRDRSLSAPPHTRGYRHQRLRRMKRHQAVVWGLLLAAIVSRLGEALRPLPEGKRSQRQTVTLPPLTPDRGGDPECSGALGERYTRSVTECTPHRRPPTLTAEVSETPPAVVWGLVLTSDRVLLGRGFEAPPPKASAHNGQTVTFPPYTRW
jgi:hypothetical protein